MLSYVAKKNKGRGFVVSKHQKKVDILEKNIYYLIKANKINATL